MRAAAMILLVLLAGCQKKAAESHRTTIGNLSADPVVYLDRDTGCEYLAPGLGDPLTPRMDRNGKHVCRSTP